MFTKKSLGRFPLKQISVDVVIFRSLIDGDTRSASEISR